MSRKHRIVHLISFVALVASLFSPVLTLPVVAEGELPSPDVTLSSHNEVATPIGEGPGEAPIPDPEPPAENPDSIVPDDEATETPANVEQHEDVATPDSDGTEQTDSVDSGSRSSQMGSASTSTTLDYSISPTTPVAPGNQVVFTSSVHTTADIYHVGVTHTLPEGVTSDYLSIRMRQPGGAITTITPEAYSCVVAEGTVGCNLNPSWLLPSDWTLLMTVYATVDAPVEGGTCQSVRPSSVMGNWENAPTLTADLIVRCPEILQLAATDNIADDDAVRLNEVFTYTVTVSNTSDGVSGEFELMSQLPYGVVLAGDVPITHPAGTTCTTGVTGSSTVITCSGTAVPVGESNGLVFGFDVMAVDLVGEVIASACADERVTFVAAGSVGQWKSNARLVNVYTDVECISSMNYSVESLETLVQPGGTIGFVQIFHNTGDTRIVNIDGMSVPLDLPDGASWTAYVELDDVRYDADDFPLIGHINAGSVFKVFYESSPIPTDLTLIAPEWCTDFAYHSEVTVTFSNGDTQQDSDSATVQVLCHKLSIAKSDNVDTSIEVGQEFEYSITVSNTGQNNTGGYSFTDPLPAGIELVDANAIATPYGATCTPTISAGITTITCESGTSPDINGEIHWYTFQVKSNVALDADVCGDTTNTVTGGAGQWAEGANQASVVTTVTCAPNLMLVISADKTDVEPGDTITYTVTITNTGSAAEPYYVFRSGVPVGAQIAEDPEFSSSPGIECGAINETTRLVSCWSYDMQPGETHSITYTVRVSTNINSFHCQGINAPLTEQAGHFDENNPSSHAISIRCPQLRLDITDNIPEGETVGLHEPFTYTVTVTNTGESTIGDFSFASVLPDGIVLHGEQDARCEPGARYEKRAVWCSGSEVPLGAGNGSSFDINVVAVDTPVDTDYAGACPYTISYNEVHAETGVWASDSRYVEERTSVDCVSSVDFSIEPLVSNVVPGESIGFDVTVQNTGSTGITSFSTVDDVLPELPDGAEWTTTLTFNNEPINPEGLPTELASGDVLKTTFESSDIPTNLTLPNNEWCKDWTMSSTLVASFTWGQDQRQTESGAVRVNCTGLGIEQTVSSAAVEPGGEVTYTITVTNQGNTTVSPLYVFHNASDTGNVFSNWRVTGEGALDCGLIEDVDPGCVFLSLDPGGSAAVTITADAPLHPTEEQCAPVTSQAVFIYGEALTPAQVMSTMASPYTPVYSDPVVTQLDCVASFTFSAEPLSSPVMPGEAIGYTFTLHNSGTLAITNIAMGPIALPDLPESDWSFSTELNGEEFDPSGYRQLEAGDTLVVTMVNSEIPEDITLPDNEWCTDWTTEFNARVGFVWAPPQEASDSATVEVNCAGLTFDMEVNAPVIRPGEQVVYTATVTNHGNVTVAPVLVAMDLMEPSTVFTNLTISSDFEGQFECSFIPGANTPIAACLFEGLLPEESVTLIVTGNAPELPTLAQCGVIENQALFLYGLEVVIPTQPVLRAMSVPITPPELPMFSNLVTTRIDCQPEVGVSLDSEINPGNNNRVDAGDTVTYTMVVTNSGNMALYDIAVSSDLAEIEWDRELVIDELLPGESVTFTGTYLVSQGDIDAGQLEVFATVNAALEPVMGVTRVQFVGLAQVAEPLPILPESVSDSVTETTVFTREPGIQLMVAGTAISGDDDPVTPGDTITYTFTVTNTGNVTLTDVQLIGSLQDLVWEGETSIASLTPGETVERTATYLVTEADAGNTITTCIDITTAEGAVARGCVDIEVPALPDETVPDETETPTPVPTMPPATPLPEAPAAVTGLPETGHGISGIAPVLWAAAMLGMLALGFGGMGVRRMNR